MQAVADCQLLDTPRESRFDDLIELTAERLNAPFAAFCLVDESRCWFKSIYGMEAEYVERKQSFCTRVVATNAPLVLEDTDTHSDFSQLPLVVDSPNIAFYAGVPIRANGQPVGSLCIMDTKSRDFAFQDFEQLKELGKMVEEELGKSKQA